MENGTISTFLNQNLKENDEVEVQQPMGNFCTNYHASNHKNYVGIAAGSGISPVLSNLKEALFQEPNAKVLLFLAIKFSKYFAQRRIRCFESTISRDFKLHMF